MKRFRTGVIVGKFYPPHRGHHYLIDAALSQCDRLHVLLCWKPEYTVPVAVRYACLREAHPEADVRVVEDVLPDDDSKGWADHTRQLLGFAPEAVFTSEDYGDAYARYMGAVHVQVDRQRTRIPCSGTRVRAAPLEHLQWLHPVMRAYYVKRVAVVGAESTGTTTLAQALAAHYCTHWVPEYGRDYCASKWGHGFTNDWETNEFVHIATEQSRRENEAARSANKVLICDTDAFATGLWHQRYMKKRSPEVEAVAARRPADLYLLTGDEIPFVQDGLRDGEHIRHWMHQLFLDELKATHRPYELLIGAHDVRLKRAVELVDQLLA